MYMKRVEHLVVPYSKKALYENHSDEDLSNYHWYGNQSELPMTESRMMWTMKYSSIGLQNKV